MFHASVCGQYLLWHVPIINSIRVGLDFPLGVHIRAVHPNNDSIGSTPNNVEALLPLWCHPLLRCAYGPGMYDMLKLLG